MRHSLLQAAEVVAGGFVGGVEREGVPKIAARGGPGAGAGFHNGEAFQPGGRRQGILVAEAVRMKLLLEHLKG